MRCKISSIASQKKEFRLCRGLGRLLLLRLEILDSCLDRVLSKHAAMQLYRRKVEVVGYFCVLNLHSIIHLHPLHPLRGHWAASDGWSATESLHAVVGSAKMNTRTRYCAGSAAAWKDPIHHISFQRHKENRNRPWTPPPGWRHRRRPWSEASLRLRTRALRQGLWTAISAWKRAVMFRIRSKTHQFPRWESFCQAPRRSWGSRSGPQHSAIAHLKVSIQKHTKKPSILQKFPHSYKRTLWYALDDERKACLANVWRAWITNLCIFPFSPLSKF